jgi:RimJ/RimL family protein N-acetyltransferase
MDLLDRLFDSLVAGSIARDTSTVHLADGAAIQLRAASGDHQDDGAFRRFFFTLSDSTRYLYFCAGVPANDAWAERVVALGHAESDTAYVLVAEVDGELVGLARFSQSPQMAATEPHSMEVGMLITDAWQGRGLGTAMLHRLASEARVRDVTTFTAITLWENRRMLRLGRRVFPGMRVAYASGVCEMTMDLVG